MKTILTSIVLFFTFHAFGQGNGWELQNPLPTANWLNDIQVFDELTAISVGYSGTILKTSDGGSTWSIQNSGTTNNLTSVHFIDAQTGWAVGWNGTILKTNNGGTTWVLEISGTTS